MLYALPYLNKNLIFVPLTVFPFSPFCREVRTDVVLHRLGFMIVSCFLLSYFVYFSTSSASHLPLQIHSIPVLTTLFQYYKGCRLKVAKFNCLGICCQHSQIYPSHLSDLEVIIWLLIIKVEGLCAFARKPGGKRR